VVKTLLKRVEVYVLFLVVLSIMVVSFIINSSEKLSNNIKNSIIKVTDVYFDDIVNTRKWNAQYGGVYVLSNNKIKPNPYLMDNHLYSKDGELLVKINPAWMTRQLSNFNQNKTYSFKIVSQTPINPINITNKFESKGLEYLKQNQKNRYYEFDNTKKEFRYIGKLVAKKPCLVCHPNYNEGDIRGGISITKNIKDEIIQLQDIEKEKNYLIIIVLTATLLIVILIIKIFNSNKYLEKEIAKRTQNLEDERHYLETIKNANKDILVVTNGEKLIDANKAFLDFFGVNNIFQFLEYNDCICDFFENIDEKEYINNKIIDGVVWTKFILDNKHNTYKVMIKRGDKEYIFMLTAQYLKEDIDTILVVLSDITTIEKSKNRLEYIASIDELTKIMNRAKFNDVMEDEIEIAQINNSPLSIIFFDIDFFKSVNDTYGHDIGDKVLKDLATVVKEHIRKDDFFARWGGEEFVIIVKDDIDTANSLAEKLREIVANYEFKGVSKVTCSFGVSTLKSSDTFDTLIKRSDDALYLSKQNGRNRVTQK
jgi:diguanylate cyclase (GGDEF)-like protein